MAFKWNLKLIWRRHLTINIAGFPEPEEASMWTRKDITDFKDTIRSEESDAIIKVSHWN